MLGLALLVVSCDILGSGSNQRDARMKEESGGLVWSYLINPTTLLHYLLLTDQYFEASEEERSEERFDEIRKNLYKGDDGTWLFEQMGVLDTHGTSLRTPGTKWSLSFTDKYYYPYGAYFFYSADLEGWTFECVSDSLYSAVASTGTATAIQVDGEGFYTVATFGDTKTADGYDCSFRTEGEFKLGNLEMGFGEDFMIKGKFFHSVGRGSTVLESCQAVYSGSRDAEYKLNI